MVIDQLQSDFEKLQGEIRQGPVVPTVTPEEIRGYLAVRYDFGKTIPLEEVVSDVENMLRAWQVQMTHPRYLGLFNPNVTFASVIADTLVAMYNPQLASWRTSPAANEIEKHTLGWLAAKFGLPPESSASFTSGGAEANLSAVIVALTHAFPEFGDGGIRSLPRQPTLYLTEETHHSFGKIAHITGLGRAALRTVATDSDLRLNVEDLARQVAEDRKNGLAPFLVIGTAGTTAVGAIDPLPEIAAFCRKEGLWFHADAAWGGAAILSPELRSHLAGIEEADSITCDAHKWLSVPMGCGMFFCRHPASVAQAFRAGGFYMPAKTTEPVEDPYSTSAQWSRRFIGLKLFMALAEQGEAGIVERIEHQAHVADVLRIELKAAGWRIVNKTPFPLVCFTRDELDIANFLNALRGRQIAWMSEARLAGASVVRACITNFKTSEKDIRWIVEEMNRLVAPARRTACA